MIQIQNQTVPCPKTSMGFFKAIAQNIMHVQDSKSINKLLKQKSF
jgi:hypothetical protein